MTSLFSISTLEAPESNNTEEIEDMVSKQIPEILKGWDKDLSTERDILKIKNLARTAFNKWVEKDPEFNSPYLLDDDDLKVETPCKSKDNMRFFEAEKPKRSSYPLKNDDGETMKTPGGKVLIDRTIYAEDLFDYRVNTAIGRRLCDQCPIVQQCLTASMTRTKAVRKPFSPENLTPDQHLVWGGLTPDERKLVFEEFEKLVINHHQSQKAVA